MISLPKHLNNEEHSVLLILNCYRNNNLKYVTELDIHRTMYIISVIYSYVTQYISDKFTAKADNLRYDYDFGCTLLGSPYSYKLQVAIKSLLDRGYIDLKSHITINDEKLSEVSNAVHKDNDLFVTIIDALSKSMSNSPGIINLRLTEYCEKEPVLKEYFEIIKVKFDKKMVRDDKYRYSILYSGGEFIKTYKDNGELNETVKLINKFRKEGNNIDLNINELLHKYINNFYVNSNKYNNKNDIVNNYVEVDVQVDDEPKDTLEISKEQFRYLTDNNVAVVVFYFCDGIWQDTIAMNETSTFFDHCKFRIAKHDYLHYFGKVINLFEYLKTTDEGMELEYFDHKFVLDGFMDALDIVYHYKDEFIRTITERRKQDQKDFGKFITAFFKNVLSDDIVKKFKITYIPKQ